MWDGTSVFGTIAMVVILGTLFTGSVGGLPAIVGIAIGLGCVYRVVGSMNARDSRDRRKRGRGQRRRR